MKFGVFVGNAGRSSGGPEVYETQLIRSFASLDRQNEFHMFCLSNKAKETIGVKQENFLYHQLWPASFRPVSMTVGLNAQLLRYKTDSLHATFMPPPFSVQAYMLTLVCFSMFRHPEFYPAAVRSRLRALITLGVRAARVFLCVSANVRDLFAEEFRIPMDRMVVTPMGTDPMFRPLPPELVESELVSRFGIRSPYFLYSGRWERRKNIFGIIEAFARFKHDSPGDHKLVFTGSRTWAAREADELIARHRLQKHVVDLGKSDVAELPLLYNGAQALVYASLWEGFGMPIAEAMACGTPVITSNISSMPEVAGEAALLVDPYSIDEIADAMSRIAGSSDLRCRLRASGLERSKQFKWEETGRRTLAAYRMMAEAQ
jgi:glycosyltransferase involved in cell wall biosynthesis